MKVVKQDGGWDIVENGEVIATIECKWRFNKADAKVLWVGDKEICEVKNQKEALKKLKELRGE